jgi:hypothetical protein
MDIDKEQYKIFLRQAFTNMKQLETELMAYRLLAHTLKRLHPDVPVDDFLASARQNHSLLKRLDEKYEPYLARVLASIDQTATDQEIEEFLRSWKPESGLQN